MLPGDTAGVTCYERFVTILGARLENLTYCVGLLNAYFKATVGSEAIVVDKGVPRLPLQLHKSFAWKATDKKYKNHDIRRDIYAAWLVLRDRCSGAARSLSSIGRIYQQTNPTWGFLSAQEISTLYQPATAKPRITLGTITIRGAAVTEFTA